MKLTAHIVLLGAIAMGTGCASVDRAMSDVKQLCPKPETALLLGASEWVVVGNLLGGLGSFEELEPGSAFAAYDSCSDETNLLSTAEEFRMSMAGWTDIEIGRVDVPLLFSTHSKITVLVPHGVLERDDFDVGIPGVWMGYGDLVAARWTTDGVFVVSKVLCNSDENYRQCARQYERGLFDLKTGLEHSRDGEQKRSTVRIDVRTYKKIDESAQLGADD